MTSERPIGGEMPITAEHLAEPSGPGAWPAFGKPHALRCDTGRAALQLALLDWKSRVSEAGKVWVPSYTCASVPTAIAQLGLQIRFYPDRPGLQQWHAVPRPAAQDIVIVIHYFGVANRVALEWAASSRNQGWKLIEDCVQSPYTAAAGVSGDYAITSLRKWWPAPDGALVCANHPLVSAELVEPNERIVSQRFAAKLLRAHRIAEATYLKWIEESEQALEPVRIRQVAWISSELLGRADGPGAARLRCANWLTLAGALDQHPVIRPVFAELASGEVPLAFPVRVPAGARDELRRFLASRDIYCPIHWRMPPEAPESDRELSAQMLSIPLDQRYGPQDMHIVISCLSQFFSGSRS